MDVGLASPTELVDFHRNHGSRHVWTEPSQAEPSRAQNLIVIYKELLVH